MTELSHDEIGVVVHCLGHSSAVMEEVQSPAIQLFGLGPCQESSLFCIIVVSFSSYACMTVILAFIKISNMPIRAFTIVFN